MRLDIRCQNAMNTPVVALESTLIAHGLPYPANVRTARESEAAVRAEGATPATIAVLHGVPTVGLTDEEIERLAKTPGVLKASRRDLASAIANGRTAATTVSATMALAHAAGIRVFATGGIGGVHKSPSVATGRLSWDVSADLVELARTPVAVVCAGAKSLLDLPNTLEMLESLGVPVVCFGCDEFPAFYLSSSGLPAPARVDNVEAAAKLLHAHWQLGGAGVVIAQPPPKTLALEPAQFNSWLIEAERLATVAKVAGPAITPFVLARLAELSNGKTVELNQGLIVANARLAAQISRALCAK
jgi:pseudouridylate synthase